MLHSDCNNYYASVECIGNEGLRGVPMVVCGDPATRHGIVLSKNDHAKAFGILTGESVHTARRKAPGLTVVNADYPKYVRYAKAARRLYGEYGGEVVPYGLDEAWIDLTGRVGSIEEGAQVADAIRGRMKGDLGLTVSVGVSYNYLFSKMASDMRKPDATSTLRREDLRPVIWGMPAFELLFVGPVTRRKLRAMNILTVGDLARAGKDVMQKKLGKAGLSLWQFANGDDSSFDPRVPVAEPFKSFGNTITTPKDMADPIDVYSMLYVLSSVVAMRLRKHGLLAGCISLNYKHADFTAVVRQCTAPVRTDEAEVIFSRVKALFDGNHEAGRPIRSIGVHVRNLGGRSARQHTLFDGERAASPDLRAMVDGLRAKLGDFNVERSAGGADCGVSVGDVL